MPLKHLKITGVGGIQSLSVNFDPHFNLICGPNGIGKSTVLDAINQSLTSQPSKVKRSAKFDQGQVELEGTIAGQTVLVTIKLSKFLPDDNEHIHGQPNVSRWLLSFPVQRDFGYSKLTNIAPDPAENEVTDRAQNSGMVHAHDIKNWFVYRFLYSAHTDGLSPAQKANHQLARDLFGVLEAGFSFGAVESKKSEIMVDTPSGRIPFEYLSSGFRSCLIMVWGLIKEIEHRFPTETCNAKTFSGTVLIDEIEVHLHPNWQKKICGALGACFPNAQFIVTTHSPHVVQSAAAHTVLPLQAGAEGGVSVRKLGELPFGFQGWTLEEILIDVMGVDSLEGTEYQNAVANFSSALIQEDVAAAKEAFATVDAMLHSASFLRDIFRRQLNDLVAEHA